MTDPAFASPSSAPVLVRLSAGAEVIVTVSGSLPVTPAPVGGAPPVDARFTTEPAFTSFWVTV